MVRACANECFYCHTCSSTFIKENSGLAVVLKSYEITQNLGAKSSIDLISRLYYGIVYLSLVKQRLFLIITIAHIFTVEKL